MEYELRFSTEDDVLIVHAGGKRNLEAELSACEKIFEKCKEHNPARLLLVCCLKGEMPLVDAFIILQHIAQKIKNFSFKTALVDYNEVPFRENLIEGLMSESETAEVTLFYNMKEANAYLNSKN